MSGYRRERSRARRRHRRQRSPSASDTSYASGVSEGEYSIERGRSYSDGDLMQSDVQSDGQSDEQSDSLQDIDASPDDDNGEGASVNYMHMHPLNFSCKIMFTIKKKKMLHTRKHKK